MINSPFGPNVPCDVLGSAKFLSLYICTMLCFALFPLGPFSSSDESESIPCPILSSSPAKNLKQASKHGRFRSRKARSRLRI